ncbi:MAG: DNA polymerase IIIc chi subunit [Rickettsiales bacterium]|jgi:DNA polymerase IIIc chi subunit
MEINFYQVDDIIHRSIAPVLTKILDENKKALIYCKNEGQKTEIDNGLWSFGKTKFIPHATIADKLDHSLQPIFITEIPENTNKADYLIMLNEAENEMLSHFERIFYFFGSGDLQDARRLWKKYKADSAILSFYKKSEGTWAKINL